MRSTLVLSFIASGLVLYQARSHAITVGEVDAFTSSLEGWGQGQASSAVSRVSFGGPDGGAYMRVIADSAASQGRIVVFNQGAWSGDYLAAGVTSITMSVNNLGATDLSLRLALGTAFAPMSGGSWLSSTTAVSLPSGSGWTNIEFPLSASAMTLVDGSDDFDSIMGSVVTLRLLHATAPGSVGNLITGTLGVDNITAVGTPPILGDFDGNQVVDGVDLTQWRADFGAGGSDADGDGDSDGNDFLIWQRQLSASPATAVPEPHAAAGILVAASLLACLRSANRRAKKTTLNSPFSVVEASDRSQPR
jgi:hypothetical protein